MLPRRSIRNTYRLIAAMILSGTVWGSHADVPAEPMAFLVVYHHGRVKPLDTYARNLLRRCSGKQRIGDRSSIQWITELLFGHPHAERSPIFRIAHTELRDALWLEKRSGYRYSYQEIKSRQDRLAFFAYSSIRIPHQAHTAFHRAALKLYIDFLTVQGLFETFSFVDHHGQQPRSLSDSTRLAANPPCTPSRSPRQAPGIDPIVPAGYQLTGPGRTIGFSEPDPAPPHRSRPGDPLVALDETGQVHLIPSRSSGVVRWMTPREAVFDPTVGEELSHLVQARQAFLHGDQQRFLTLVTSFRDDVFGKADIDRFWIPSRLEVAQNRIRPFFWAKIAYLLAFAFFLGYWTPVRGLFGRHFLSKAFLGTGFLIHSLGLFVHAVSWGSIPVLSIFEKCAVVGWIATVTGSILAFSGKRTWAFVLTSLAGVGSLWIGSTLMGSVDPIGAGSPSQPLHFALPLYRILSLLAVGAMFVAGIIAHIRVIWWLRRTKDTVPTGDREMHLALRTGLVLLCAAFVFGAAWFEQQHGRFWILNLEQSAILLAIVWSALLLIGREHNLIDNWYGTIGTIVGFVLAIFALIGTDITTTGDGESSSLGEGFLAFAGIVVADFGFLLFALIAKAGRRFPRGDEPIMHDGELA